MKPHTNLPEEIERYFEREQQIHMLDRIMGIATVVWVVLVLLAVGYLEYGNLIDKLIDAAY